jgi:hypothetical protein
MIPLGSIPGDTVSWEEQTLHTVETDFLFLTQKSRERKMLRMRWNFSHSFLSPFQELFAFDSFFSPCSNIIT